VIVASLLDRVIEVHGGVDRWKRLSDFGTDITLGGELCKQNGMEEMAHTSRILLSLRQHRTITLLPDQQGILFTEPNLISFANSKGDQLYSISPREFIQYGKHHALSTLFRTAYFGGFFLRYAVMSPFLYADPGFVTEEVEPWHEQDEEWKVLKVTFPVEQALPFRVQYAYYGPDGLLRRTRNATNLFKGLDVVNYVKVYQTIDGIQMPTSREVFACNRSGHKIGSHPTATIDLAGSFFSD
jgi:hypothetical protein